MLEFLHLLTTLKVSMRLLITILFVSTLAICGNCQVKDNIVQYSSHLFINSGNHLNAENVLLINDEWLDMQDANDLNNLPSGSIMPKTNSDSQNFESTRVASFITEIHSNFFSVLLLDLPPPSISI